MNIQQKLISFFLCLLLFWFLPGSVSAEEREIPERVDTADIESLVEQESGKILILNFWATWCAPCRAEIRDLVRIRDEFPEDELSIIGISFDFNPAAVPPFMQRKKMNYPVYIAAHNVMEELEVTSIPYTMIYDQDGNLDQVHDTHLDRETILTIIDDLSADSN